MINDEQPSKVEESFTSVYSSMNEDAGGVITPSKDAPLAEEVLKDPDDVSKEDGEESAHTDAEGAQTKYEFKAPEGVEFDQQILSDVTGVFEELGLSNDAAQKLVDKYFEIDSKASATREQRVAEENNALQEDWMKAALEDPEIGGSRETLAKNAKAARDALKSIGGDSFMKELALLNLENNPEFVRLGKRLHQRMSEKALVSSGPTKLPKVASFQDIYTSMK